MQVASTPAVLYVPIGQALQEPSQDSSVPDAHTAGRGENSHVISMIKNSDKMKQTCNLTDHINDNEKDIDKDASDDNYHLSLS